MKANRAGDIDLPSAQKCFFDSIRINVLTPS